MFTGPGVLLLVGIESLGQNIPNPCSHEWRVFIKSTYVGGTRHLDAGTMVLYEVINLWPEVI